MASRPPGYNQALQGDPSFVLQIAEKEQELLASQETVQVGEEGTLMPKGQLEACRGKTLPRQQVFRLDVSCVATQVLQMKVKRLEHLLQLKNVRIDDLSRRLQQAERKQR